MAWRYPPHNVKSSRVVEMEDVNEDFQVYAEEASGHLNEHNFASNLFTGQRARLAEDIGIRLYRQEVVSDSNASPLVNAVLLGRAQDRWRLVKDMTLTVVSPGSSVFVTFSAQLTSGDPLERAVMFGLMMNGALLPNSVLGGLDLQNDTQGYGYNAGDINISNQIGLYGRRLAICVEVTQNLLPGEYTFQPVFYLPTRQSGGANIWVTNRELFIIETVR